MKQCVTTEDRYANHDLYLKPPAWRPGFRIPSTREPKAIEKRPQREVPAPEYSQKVYGAVFNKDDKGVYSASTRARPRRSPREIRKERPGARPC